MYYSMDQCCKRGGRDIHSSPGQFVATASAAWQWQRDVDGASPPTTCTQLTTSRMPCHLQWQCTRLHRSTAHIHLVLGGKMRSPLRRRGRTDRTQDPQPGPGHHSRQARHCTPDRLLHPHTCCSPWGSCTCRRKTGQRCGQATHQAYARNAGQAAVQLEPQACIAGDLTYILLMLHTWLHAELAYFSLLN